MKERPILMNGAILALLSDLEQPQVTDERYVLKQIIDALPTRRDWLDPDVEKAARALLSAPPAAETPIGTKLYASAPPSTDAKDSELALDLLATVFDAYENGTSCCEISGGIEGEYIGNAVRLDHETSQKCADLLNRLRPRAIPDAKFAAETRIAP